MSRPRCLSLAALLLAGLGGLTPGAGAAPAVPVPALATVGEAEGLLQDVRYVTRCRPSVVNRRDRYGRPVQVRRDVCRRVWVGGRPRRHY